MSKPTASQIPRLPRLAAGTSVWRLPLNDHAVFELTRLMVLDAPVERETLVANLMSVDPAVTLWTACIWSRQGGAQPGQTRALRAKSLRLEQTIGQRHQDRSARSDHGSSQGGQRRRQAR